MPAFTDISDVHSRLGLPLPFRMVAPKDVMACPFSPRFRRR